MLCSTPDLYPDQSSRHQHRFVSSPQYWVYHGCSTRPQTERENILLWCPPTVNEFRGCGVPIDCLYRKCLESVVYHCKYLLFLMLRCSRRRDILIMNPDILITAAYLVYIMNVVGHDYKGINFPTKIIISSEFPAWSELTRYYEQMKLVSHWIQSVYACISLSAGLFC